MHNKIPPPLKSLFSKVIDISKWIVGKDGLRARLRRFGIAGTIFISGSIFFILSFFPTFLEELIQKEGALKKGWFMRKLWRKNPFPYEFRVYVFNVTNPEDIGKGLKPIVKEVGPFVYDVWQEKTKLDDDENDDTLSYSVKNTYLFNQKKSKCHTEYDELTVAHLVTLGVPIAVMKEKPTVIPLAGKAIDFIMKKPSSGFVKVSVKTLLFDGFPTDCNGMEDFFGKALCNEFKESWFKYRITIPAPNVYSISLFGGVNGTDDHSGEMRIRRGTRNIKEIGELVEQNHMTYLSIWDDDECDAIYGTDGTLFPPFVDKRMDIWVTHTSFCRHLLYKYDSTVKFSGLKLYRYTASLGSNLDTDPKDKCYCIFPGRCLKDGVYEAWKCIHNCYTVSNPHFYLADPDYLEEVDGLEPIKKKHMTILDLDPLTGWPVRVHFRFQYNLHLMKIPKVRVMKNYPEALLPVVWVDQVMIAPKGLFDRVVHFHKVILLSRLLTAAGILLGLVLIGVTGFQEYRLYKAREARKIIMRKYLARWKNLAVRRDKRKMGISLRTVMTLKMAQRNQVAAAAAAAAAPQGDTARVLA